MARIEYKRGVLLATGDNQEELEFPCQIVRFERGYLLVRIEENADGIQVGGGVELEVPAKESLYWLTGEVKQIASTSDGAPIVSMSIEDIETIQRRKQERFDVALPCRIGLMGERERARDPLAHPLGMGKVTDISLGGVEFETELELPHGSMVKLDVRAPDGRLDFAGKIVRVLVDPSGARRYGVKFGAMDSVSLSLLNRVVLRLERAERRKNRTTTLRRSGSALSSRGRWRESRRRWGR